MKLHAGDVVAARDLPTLEGTPVRVPDVDSIVHLQFRRYAGCPICTTHLRTFTVRHDELKAAGVREVAVFHSEREALRKHRSALPFDVVPDPGRQLYREFGIERSLRAVMHPRSMLAGIQGWSPARGFRAGGGGYLGLTADLLIGPDGKVLASHYGRNAADQWSVDTVLSLAGRHARS